MALDVVAILKLTPMAASAVKRYRRSDVAKNLNRLVRAQIEGDAELGPRARQSLIEQWDYLHSDGKSAVIIAGLLDKRELAYLDAFEIRATEMLDGLETLELGVEETVKQIVAAVRNNFVSAQKSPHDAAQASTSALLSAVDPLPREASVMQLGPQLTGLEALVAPAPAPRVLILSTTFDDDQHRLIQELKDKSEPAAAQLAGILNDSGLDGVATAALAAQPWAAQMPASFWDTAGRLLLEAGRLADAERAFAREADTPGVPEIVESLMAAARVAEADGRSADADTHLARAQQIDDDHPSVQLFLAARAHTAQDRLDLTDAVATQTDRQRGRKEAQRALALLDLHRFEEAADAANASADLAPHGSGRELGTLATIWKARDRVPARDRDDRPLIDAARYQLSLYERQLALGNNAKAGVAAARAALATAILGDRLATGEAIDRVLDIDGGLDEGEARSTLLSAAVAVGDGERAKALFIPGDTHEEKLQEALVGLTTGDAPRAAAILDELLPTLPSGDERDQAIAMRLAAAGDPTVSFDPSLADEHPQGASLVAGVNAQRAIQADDLAAARGYVGGLDDPPSLVLRAQIAEAEGKLTEAVSLQAALTRQFRSSENMLRLAALRARAGDHAGAIREALRLATDDRKLRSVRDAAFEIAAQAAIDSSDFEELEDIADRWGEVSPDRDDPLWVQTFALARQNRHADALLFFNRRGLEPVAEANRHRLVAELYLHAITDSATRLRALRDLSDEFGRPAELEQAFITGVLQTPDTDRPDDDALIARFQEAMSTFEERFPESGAIKTITIDPEDDGEAIINKLAAVQKAEDEQVVETRQEFIDGVRQGRLPIGFLAAMAGRSTADTVARVGAHPLGVFDRATHEQEMAAAAAALEAAAASWDETACITVGLLGEAHRPVILAALPGSKVGQSVKDSLAEAVRRQMGGEQVATMHVLPDGTPQIIEENPATVAHVRHAEEAADATAAELAATADRGLGDDELARMATESDLNPPAVAAVSALAVARHNGMVLYSDDRVLRAFARTFGLQAFGTVALIDELERRGTITKEAGGEMFRAVVDLGVWSLALEPTAYVDAARRARFDLAWVGAALLHDQMLLQFDSRLEHNALLLRVVAVEAPDKLKSWASAIILAYRELLTMEPLFVASLLLAAQLTPGVPVTDNSVRSTNTTIAKALRAVDGLDGSDPERDPALGAIRRWANVVDAADRDEIIDRLLDHFEPELAEELRRTLG